MHGPSHIVYIVQSERHHRETAISCHEDGVIITELLNLLLVETCVAEHPDLSSDVGPVARGAWVRERVEGKRGE